MSDISIGLKLTINPTLVAQSATQLRVMVATSQQVVGSVGVHFVDGGDLGSTPFSGSLLLVGRIFNTASSADQVPMVPIPFRAFYLNGAPSDGSYQPAGTLITTTSLIVVPVFGFLVGFEVQCANGSGNLYRVPLDGNATP